jgi:preprotein translocase subunit YajC
VQEQDIEMPELVAFTLVMLILMGGYWSLVVFPKQRAFKKHNIYVRTLQPGDEVITYGGIVGTLISLDSEAGVAYVKIADGVEVKVLSAALSRPYQPDDVALHAQVGIDPAAEKEVTHSA